MIKNSFREVNQRLKSENYYKPNTYGVEGVDHINISIHSTTKVGRLLDPGYSSKFDYPLIGKFVSPLALSYWLRDPDKNDAIRFLKKKEMSLLPRNIIDVRLLNYKVILLVATMARLDSKPWIKEEIKKLPDNITVLSYNVHSQSRLRITTGYASFTIGIMTEVIRAIKEDREPDYESFATDGGSIENGFLENVLDLSLYK